jgi:hypothetical protein
LQIGVEAHGDDADEEAPHAERLPING